MSRAARWFVLNPNPTPPIRSRSNVDASPSDAPPSTKQTVGSNHCLIYPTYNDEAGRYVIVSCLDNLGKGGAQGGVQCLNLMLGLPETAGLEGLALYP